MSVCQKVLTRQMIISYERNK